MHEIILKNLVTQGKYYFLNDQKVEKMKSNKKKVIIDLWNFLNNKQKNIIINKVGLSD